MLPPTVNSGAMSASMEDMQRTGALAAAVAVGDKSASMEDMQRTGALAAAVAEGDRRTPVSMSATAGLSPFDEVARYAWSQMLSDGCYVCRCVPVLSRYPIPACFSHHCSPVNVALPHVRPRCISVLERTRPRTCADVLDQGYMVSPSRGPSRLSSGLSSSDGGQGSSNSASGENSAQTSWQGQGPGSRASSAQSSLHGLSVGTQTL